MNDSGLKITEVQVLPIKPKDGLVGFASVVINSSVYLGSIGIHQKADGINFRLTYPTRNTLDRAFNIFHPINQETSKLIEDAVISKFKDVMTKLYVGHGGTSFT
jgi:stage V sporulation protein G